MKEFWILPIAVAVAITVTLAAALALYLAGIFLPKIDARLRKWVDRKWP